MSGFVESEKIGCSIDAISPLGAASKRSHTKKSGVGYRSGRRGERDSFDISPTMLTSIFHTQEARSFDISPTDAV